MIRTTYRDRRAVSIENRDLRVTVLEGGGHIAEILDKESGLNPLWSPIWPSVEPEAFGPGHYGRFGRHADGPLLATGVRGQSRELTARNLLRAFIVYPWMTLGVILRIHYQALRLWLKGVRYHTKPTPPLQETTR